MIADLLTKALGLTKLLELVEQAGRLSMVDCMVGAVGGRTRTRAQEAKGTNKEEEAPYRLLDTHNMVQSSTSSPGATVSGLTNQSLDTWP
jgi:hypothetical protein